MYEGFAIDNATRLNEIRFGEFTSELIKEVFTALLDAEMTQMEAYKELVKVLSQDLSTYINNTANDVPLGDIEDFITSLNLPDGADTQNLINAVNDAYENMTTASGTSAPAPTPNNAVSGTALQTLITTLGPIVQDVVSGLLPSGQSAPATVDLNASTSPATVFGQTYAQTMPNYNAIYKAIAGKIANDKYTLLQGMVRMGLMRLVIDNGTIETRLTFDTYETHSDETKTTHRDRTVTKEKERQGRGATLISGFIKPGNGKGGRARGKRRTVTVNTAKNTHRDTAGSHVQIFGRVEIKFKTDYVPLAQQ